MTSLRENQVALRISQWALSRSATTSAGDLLTAYELLNVLPEAWSWTWRLSNIHTGGGRGTFAIETWAKRGAPVPGNKLRCALQPGAQLWWGQLVGYAPDHIEPVLTIEAMDSSWFDITGSDEIVAELDRRLSKRFPGPASR